MKFRKKPVVVEAFQWTGDESCLPFWCWDNDGISFNSQDDTMAIDTLEGTMIAQKGSWILRGIKGELYPVRDDIFHETYERVEE